MAKITSFRIKPGNQGLMGQASRFMNRFIPSLNVTRSKNRTPEVGDPFAALKASPFDFGTVPPGADSLVTLEIPGTSEIFFRTTNVELPIGGFVDFDRTNPVETSQVTGQLDANTLATAGTHTALQVLTIGNGHNGPSAATFELVEDGEVIAFGTLDVILL